MAEERRRTLTPEELNAVLKRLDAVMQEAEELRREVTRQLQEQRSRFKQKVTPPSPPARRTRKGR
jgi:hypothetical protein